LGDEPDGSLTVRFRAGGFPDIAHHLLTWWASVTIVVPKALEDRMRKLVAAVHCPLLWNRRSVPRPALREKGSASPFDRNETAPGGRRVDWRDKRGDCRGQGLRNKSGA
jgi:hypothetical protein